MIVSSKTRRLAVNENILSDTSINLTLIEIEAFLTSFGPLAPHFPSRVRVDRFLIPPVHFLKDSAQRKRPARAWSPSVGVVRTAILTGEGGERLHPLVSAPEKIFLFAHFSIYQRQICSLFLLPTLCQREGFDRLTVGFFLMSK